MCRCLHSHEHPNVDESGLKLNNDISLDYKWPICNIVPHELVKILCITPTQEDKEGPSIHAYMVPIWATHMGSATGFGMGPIWDSPYAGSPNGSHMGPI